MADDLGVLKIHYPLDRPETQQLRADCQHLVEGLAAKLNGQSKTAVLLTDHNTHTGMPAWGGRRLTWKGIDYIGVSQSFTGAQLRVLKTKVVNGTIDNHDFIGVKVRVTWQSGKHTNIWFVQANLGRGESTEVFVQNAMRLKRAFRGNVVWGFDEIDEADGPNEHALLKKIWNPNKYQFCGGDSLSLVVVSPRLKVKNVEVIKACNGLAHVTPHRDLVKVVIGRPWRLGDN